ncbi:OLC1v1019265C3 [Oldenlandia corymbosa var. corymbosa]|uniref:OLC1v1019265C3 n=1 Tax=Oldenlandia corymbosa var. corymbosa TaxID=529605 RepID=A0AAV1EDY3_OLDCO|nr:OLC1v1019265C3 [Oldenlandia corymbosa var. corymbosa]
MSSTLSLCFNLNPPQSFPSRIQHDPFLNFPSPSSSSLGQDSVTKYSHVRFTFSPPNSNGGNNPLSYGPQEEARWLREEQRWLREEQRWLREESRWKGEKEALLIEIQRLSLRIQELEALNSAQQASVTEAIANIAKLLQVLKEGELGKNINIISGNSSSALPFVVDSVQKDDEVIIKEVVKPPEAENKVKKRAPLRMGSEGDDVQAMQQALQKLGFYSGEEDMEFSSFSSGTERAVKTWQSSLGVLEDGIMTADLLERLFADHELGEHSLTERKSPEESDIKIPEKKGANGAATASITEISEVEKTVVRKGSETEVDVTKHRVFLLGENRWEEPSRLTAGRNKPPETKSGKTTIKCLTCRGEGRLLCMGKKFLSPIPC